MMKMSTCGYCGNRSGSFSYYASTSSLQPEFYQDLLHRGWRRSGTTLYKPDLRESCCPHYTIRLDSHLFKASKSQRQVINRFNKHILGDDYTKEAARLNPKSREQAKKRDTEFDLLERVHESETEQIKTPAKPAHAFTITLEPDEFTEEKYVLFENYQRVVHHEPPSKISRGGFQNFLCSSPIPQSVKIIDGKMRQLGSYHQCYRIDGKLVAIGVLDLLPQCVSAVYLMYHEDVHSHEFGKLSALREIALAKEDGYRYWYAGFYIHSCVKMKYKRDYSPQYVLDPELYTWILFDDNLLKKMDERKYVSQNQEDTPTTTALQQPQGQHTQNADSDDDAEVPNPSLPVWERSMPGLLTREELLTQVDLDHIKLRLRDIEAEACQLVRWDTGSIDDIYSLKGMIAELVSAVGVELAREMVWFLG
ncbi:Arginyl-tRNA--protein transferase 1 [Clarireedia jacksonii]